MDLFFVLLGLLLLAFPIIAIAALVKSVGLGEHLRRVEARLAAFERGMAAATPPAPAPPKHQPVPPASEPTTSVPEPEAPAKEAVAPPEREPPIAVPIAPPPQPAPIAPRMSLEERLGTQWAVWVGGVAVVLGGIFLVRYSIEQGLLGPVCGSRLAHCWQSRSSWPANGHAAVKGFPELPGCRRRIFPAF
jgi:HAMP domain-containing protein